MKLSESIADNLSFVIICVAVVALFVALSVVYERVMRTKSGSTERILSTRKIVVIGIFSAIATILFMLDFPVMFAPAFYKLDFSELPAIIAAFAYGPVAGVMIELIKILLKLVIKGTSTAFVGELANFMVGVSFVLPAAMIYLRHKTRKTAIVSCVVATVIMAVFGSVFNAVYLLPAFSSLYGMPLEAIIDMGHKINPAISDVTTFVALAVAPLNLLKGLLVSLITLLVYKKLSPVLKSGFQSGGNKGKKA